MLQKMIYYVNELSYYGKTWSRFSHHNLKVSGLKCLGWESNPEILINFLAVGQKWHAWKKIDM